MQSASAAIRIDRVSKSFELDGESIAAVDDVDLVVNEGEFVAIIGPSGCGKSTILRMVAALEQPTSGRVSIGELPPSELARRHRLGVAFQDHALLPWLTVRKNIELPFRIANRPIDSQYIDHLLNLVGLSDFARARPKQLSGGMRQRVSIARALALQPEVLLLDEPFGALDQVTRRHLNIELQRIWSESKITAMLITHSVDEALFLSDRVVILSGRPGRIIKIVKVPFERPRTPIVMRDSLFHELSDDLTESLEGFVGDGGG